MSDPRKDLPPVTAPNFLEKVREALQTYLGNRGNALDQGLTRRDLQDFGLVDQLVSSRVGSILPGALAGALDGIGGGTGTGDGEIYEPDLTPPPTPTGFTASAAITNLLLSCGSPNYTQGHGHAKSRLYGAKYTTGPLPVFANAVMLTEFSGTVYSYATDPATTWHLWLTWVSVDGVESLVPAGGTNGVVVTTGEDVALLLEALAKAITESELSDILNARIDLIDVGDASLTALLADARTRLGAVDTPVTGTVALAQKAADDALAALAPLQAQIEDIIGSPNYDNATSYLTGQFVKYDGKLYQAIADTTGNLPTNATYWKLIGEYASIGDAVAALNVAVSDHASRLGVVEGKATAQQTNTELLASAVEWNENLIDINLLGYDAIHKATRLAASAAIQLEQETRADETGALANQTLELYAKYDTNVAGLVVEQETRATRDSATSSQVTTLVADVQGNKASLVAEQVARADATSATSSQITTLTATVKDSAASLVAEQQTRADATSAVSSQVATMAAETGDNRASLKLEQLARTTDTIALSSQITTLAAATENAKASLKLEQEARADASEAVSSQLLRMNAEFGDNKAGILSEQSARSDAVSATATKLDLLTAKTGASDAAIVSEKQVRTTDTGALASQVSTLRAVADNLSASISSLELAIADSNGALSSRSTLLQAGLDYNEDLININFLGYKNLDLTTRARIANVEEAKIGYSTKAGVLFDNNGAIKTKDDVDAWNAANPANPAVWNVGLPLARAVKQFSVTDANGSAASIEQAFTVQKTLNDGFKAQYTIKMDIDGVVSGYGLYGSTTGSKFIANVNTFAVTIPESSVAARAASTAYALNTLVRHATSYKTEYLQCVQAGTTSSSTTPDIWGFSYGTRKTDGGVVWQTVSRVPFSVSSVVATADGTTISIGAYMDGAFIRKATISSAQIGSVNADSIITGVLSSVVNHTGDIYSGVAPYTLSTDANTGITTATATGYAPGSVNFGTGYYLGTLYGSAQMFVGSPTQYMHWNGSALAVKGTVYATAGQIGGITIASSSVRAGQTAYNTGTGFYLGSDGKFSLGKSDGNRLTWDGTNLNVYSPQFTLNNGSATFAGNITGASGTFSGSITGATGEFAGTLRAGVVDLTSSIGSTTTYATPGTYTLTVPALMNRLRVSLWGAGGGGGGGHIYSTYGSPGAGGGGGGYASTTIAVTPGQTYTLVVGAGGVGGEWLREWERNNAGKPGTDGGDTYLNGYISAGGGKGGMGSTIDYFGGAIGGAAGSGLYSTAGESRLLSQGENGGKGGNSQLGTGGATSGASGGVGAGGAGGNTGVYVFGGGVGGNGGRGHAVVEFFDANGVILKAAFDTLKSELRAQGHTLS